MIPVKINGSWYDEKGLELWREVEGALMRYRRGIGLIILGFVALVTLIASSITAACPWHNQCKLQLLLIIWHKMYPLPWGLKKILTKS